MSRTEWCAEDDDVQKRMVWKRMVSRRGWCEKEDGVSGRGWCPEEDSVKKRMVSRR